MLPLNNNNVLGGSFSCSTSKFGLCKVDTPLVVKLDELCLLLFTEALQVMFFLAVLERERGNTWDEIVNGAVDVRV